MTVGAIMILIGCVLLGVGSGSIALLFTIIPAALFIVGGLICIGVSASKEKNAGQGDDKTGPKEAGDEEQYGFINPEAMTVNDDRSIIIKYNPASDRITSDEIKIALERAYIALSGFQFDEAARHFDRVLDIDPHFAPAYLGRLLCSLKIRDERNLPYTQAYFPKDHNWDSACRFATEEELKRYNGYLELAKEEHGKIKQRAEEEKRREEDEKTRQEELSRKKTKKELIITLLIFAALVAVMSLLVK